ncbi:hypothetical protein [Bernardetia sp.]|uniref:hypothetical protein n=1 Tax=Bernardetia sp. TaxID=1937974 RepID=UPI0025C17486|nr:hypothetical protein [Bernardetia sp.]
MKTSNEYNLQDIYIVLDRHFFHNYNTSVDVKLPSLALYAILECLVSEISRYENSKVEPLESVITSKGLENNFKTKKGRKVVEYYKIQLHSPIGLETIKSISKIIGKHKIDRFYLLSHDVQEMEKIEQFCTEIKAKTDCEVIVDGILPTIKYYLRLINSLSDFIEKYSLLVQNDTELKKVHKEKWNELLKSL